MQASFTTCFLALGLFLGSTFAQAQQISTTERTLRGVGLSPNGRFWITADELELRRQLVLLPREEKAFYVAQQQFRALQGQYQLARGQLQRSQSKLTEVLDLLGNNSTGALQRQQLESESQRIAEQIAQAEKIVGGRLNALDESSEMTKATVDLVNAQNSLGVMLLDLRQRMNNLSAAYSKLAENERVQQALASLPENQTLGPMENYLPLAKKLERLESLVFLDGVPLYHRSKQIRITGILDERWPVTFSFTGPSGATILPASAVAGIEVDLSKAPLGSKIELEQEAVVTRRVVLPSLRIGKHVWHQVPVDVLPPEAEHVGARISLQAFDGVTGKAEENNLWFRLTSPE